MLKRLLGFFAGSGASPNAPVPLPIHPDDRDLVSPADFEWFRRQTVADIQAMSIQDQTFQYATFLKFEDEGLSSEAIAAKCRKHFPYYYYTLEVRQQDRWQAEDALLPFHVKDRVNRAAPGLAKSAVESSSTMNALIRRLIRSGQI